MYYIIVVEESFEFKFDFSYQDKWKPVSVQYDHRMIQNYTDVIVGAMITKEPLGSQINIHISSTVLMGGWIYIYIDKI